MRIGLVSPYSLAQFGGVQGQVAGLAEALTRRGHLVVVAAPEPTGGAAQRLMDQGIQLIDAGATIGIRANGSVAPVSLDLRASVAVRRALVRFGVDVVHLHEPLAPSAGYACILKPPAPLVGTFHRAGGGAKFHLLAPIRPLLGARLKRSYAVSNAALEFSAFVTTAKVEVLFNGVDLQAVETSMPLSLAHPSIGFIGRHEKRKGLAVLLEAHRELEDVTLVIAGEGPETERLMQEYPPSPTRRWLGRVSEEEKYGLLLGAEVICAPSLGGESFGVVIIEALAARSIAVASDLPGYGEAANGHALLVGPGDPVALRAALQSGVTMATSSEGLGSLASLEASAQHAASWSLEALAARYEAAYLEAIDERPLRYEDQ